MELEKWIVQMVSQSEMIESLAGSVSPDQARWKPDPQSWSILEVVNHLYDEEREDFRVRLEIILFQPDRPWPPIDPQGWVTQRGYNQRELSESLLGYLAERQKSINWLRSLKSPDWDASIPAPWGQPISAGDMFAAWVAHDLLHLRQLVELHYAWTVHSLAPYQIRYAGEW
jgi:hypothetical protein